ncbi:eukaryotic translation initiation factor 3, subunit 10, putative [Theileria equi strain WA]|uniref:Eukaryotic translation initiation factor 3 subunit A n=1 Tax=Theileria equi strain WA TaxID=1537102 RepID=L0AZC7_THEEQ|nr:eukaryotic translation initiation factor 3, subunit 10, putative [Theileria equi strain WA]AFZ80366.1 eukaryotic translation initiation factor 3, subunit 10, putative [Theileria equi strain WA]|eukprot:XP_004830032.1 eukaryotic translation initiation factor 3, subunit 10, putative [Theileria equi strain WA]
MHNFQKPENALKRAAELRNIGQNDEALQILHSAIGHRFFRTQGWDTTQERIMLEYVALCIDQDKLRMARDGLHQYRLIAQHANVASLGKVIVELLDRAESRLHKIKATIPTGEEKVDISDYDESPDTLIACTLQVELRDPTTKTLHDVYRFLWEIYKMILDIMRATPKLEKVYHETARKAIVFCRENGRVPEFKRLCDVLRGHYSFLLKVSNKPEMECMLRPELHIETRINQLISACDMGLWKEAFNTVEDLYTLGIRDYITKTFQGSVSVLGQQKEKLLKWLAIFYEKLALIFWVSDLHLFHALAVLRYVMHIRMYKKKVSQEDITYLSSKSVLAVLSVPNYQKEPNKSNDLTSVLSTSSYEMQKRMSTLLGYNTIPNKESLRYALTMKNILPLADENTKKLYSLIENESDNSMKLCLQLVPLLTEKEEEEEDGAAKTGDKFCDKLSIYYPKIKSVVFHKVLLMISKVYASMTISFFTKSICPPEFYEWNDAEKEIVELVHRGLCHIRFDYANSVLYFNSSSVSADSIASIRHQLTDLGKNLYYAMKLLTPEETKRTQEERHLQLVSMKNNIEKERTRLMKRTSEIYQRRQEHQEEQMRVEEERKKLEMQQKINEEKAEKERREEALRQMEIQRRKDEKYKIKSETAQQMLQEIRKLGGAQSSKIMIKGKTLDEINVDDVIDGFVEYDDLEKAQEEQLIKERQECIKQRRAEIKRIDHFVRAIREHDILLYPEWQNSTCQEDTKLLMEVQKRRESKFKEDSEVMKQEKEAFMKYIDDKNKWVENHMAIRRQKFEREHAEQTRRFKEMLVKEKIQRARDRRIAEIRRQEAINEAKRREEEMRRKQLEEEKRLEEEALMKQKLAEMAEKQRAKELEIEKRLMASGESRSTEPSRFIANTTKSSHKQPDDDSEVWRAEPKKSQPAKPFRSLGRRQTDIGKKSSDEESSWRR